MSAVYDPEADVEMQATCTCGLRAVGGFVCHALKPVTVTLHAIHCTSVKFHQQAEAVRANIREVYGEPDHVHG